MISNRPGRLLHPENAPYVNRARADDPMSLERGYSQVSGVAVGDSYLFVNIAGCHRYFQYTKTGIKVASYPSLISTVSRGREWTERHWSFPAPVNVK